MTIFHSLILGVLQGITEFLPISSSGHLVLLEGFMSLPVKDLLVFDIAVHFGTLLSIFFFFRKDFCHLIKSFLNMIKDFFNKTKTVSNDDKKLIFGLVISTIPAVIVALIFSDFLENVLRSNFSVAIMMILTASYFIFSEKFKINRNKNKNTLNIKDMVIIGISQAVAIAPGISRSGATIATGVSLGMDRQESARFSFLFGSIAISGATVLSIFKVFKGEMIIPSIDILVVGILSSFLSGLLAVSFFMKFLKKNSLIWFSLYLYIVGFILLFL